MSIEQADVIDAIGVDRQTGKVILTVVDPWDWGDVNAHLLAVQEKLNAYLRFVESGELVASYPNGKGRDIAISIVAKERFPEAALEFFIRVSNVLQGSGIELKME